MNKRRRWKKTARERRPDDRCINNENARYTGHGKKRIGERKIFPARTVRYPLKQYEVNQWKGERFRSEVETASQAENEKDKDEKSAKR